MKALNVIRKPVVTEKASQLEAKKVYAFWVNPKSTKIDIKKAFKALYGVDVADVRLLKNSPKFRKLAKGSYNKRVETQKAYISLKGGAVLDVNKFEKPEKESKVKLAAVSKKAKTTKVPKTPKAPAKKTK